MITVTHDDQEFETLGPFIRYLRHEQKMTQAKLASAIGLQSPDFISLVESGARQLSLRHIPAAARALGVDVRDLLRLALQEQFPEVVNVMDAEMFYGKPQVTVDQELAAKLAQLDSDSRRVVVAIVDRLLQLSKQH